MKFFKNLFLVLFCIGAVGGIISIIESNNSKDVVSYTENGNSNSYEDDYYYDSNNIVSSNNNNNDDNDDNNYNNNNGESGNETNFRDMGQANMQKVQDVLNKVSPNTNSSSTNPSQQSNNQTTNNQSTNGVNIVHIGGDSNNSYDGKYDQNSPNYKGTNTGSSAATKPGTNTSVTPESNTNTNIAKPNTNTGTTVTPKPDTNANNNTSTVTNPSVGGTAKPLGNRVPLDTTGDYPGIKLNPSSDKNDIVMMNINNNKSNKVTSLTGYEEPLKAAVGIFNAHKYEDINALRKYYYPAYDKTTTNLDGYSEKFVAYKVVEYHEFGQDDIDKIRKNLRILYNVEDSANVTGYYRITLKTFQYDRDINIITEDLYTTDPHYYILTLFEVDGTPYFLSSTYKR